jgi:hypothetical protein
VFDQGIIGTISPTGQLKTQIAPTYSPDIWLEHGQSIADGRAGNSCSPIAVDNC